MEIILPQSAEVCELFLTHYQTQLSHHQISPNARNTHCCFLWKPKPFPCFFVLSIEKKIYLRKIIGKGNFIQQFVRSNRSGLLAINYICIQQQPPVARYRKCHNTCESHKSFIAFEQRLIWINMAGMTLYLQIESLYF